MSDAGETYRSKSFLPPLSFCQLCVTLLSLSTESKFLGTCFGNSRRTPGELISGFFVGRADLQREALIGKK
jgi:hypothetical protein